MTSVVLITGGADGIGWATANLFKSRGFRVCLLDIDESLVLNRATELGDQHLGIQCDVTSKVSVDSAVSAIYDHFGQIDVLINNAGIGDQAERTVDQKVDLFDQVLSVHLRGTFLLSQAVLKLMINQAADQFGHRGCIVNMSSIAGILGIPGRNAYAAAKAGIVGMTKSMASEFASKGIRVNAIAPAYVKTSLVDRLIHRGAINAQAIENRTPMRRMADPMEIAEVIYFLASPQASYITGVLLPVDGGWSSFGAPEVSLPRY